MTCIDFDEMISDAAARLATIDIDDDMRVAMRLHNLRVMINADRRGRIRRDRRP
jgi:hypothetical protein